MFRINRRLISINFKLINHVDVSFFINITFASKSSYTHLKQLASPLKCQFTINRKVLVVTTYCAATDPLFFLHRVSVLFLHSFSIFSLFIIKWLALLLLLFVSKCEKEEVLKKNPVCQVVSLFGKLESIGNYMIIKSLHTLRETLSRDQLAGQLVWK